MKILAGLLAVLGALAIAAAIVYYTVPAHSLPSFLGPLHSSAHLFVSRTAKRAKRGEAALVIGIVLWVVAIIVYAVDRRATRQAAY